MTLTGGAGTEGGRRPRHPRPSATAVAGYGPISTADDIDVQTWHSSSDLVTGTVSVAPPSLTLDEGDSGTLPGDADNRVRGFTITPASSDEGAVKCERPAAGDPGGDWPAVGP